MAQQGDLLELLNECTCPPCECCDLPNNDCRYDPHEEGCPRYALPLCPHAANVGVRTGGWTLETAPDSPYYGAWVHGDPRCRRPAHTKDLVNA